MINIKLIENDLSKFQQEQLIKSLHSKYLNLDNPVAFYCAQLRTVKALRQKGFIESGQMINERQDSFNKDIRSGRDYLTALGLDAAKALYNKANGQSIKEVIEKRKADELEKSLQHKKIVAHAQQISEIFKGVIIKDRDNDLNLGWNKETSLVTLINGVWSLNEDGDNDYLSEKTITLSLNELAQIAKKINS